MAGDGGSYFSYRTPHGSVTIRTVESGVAQIVFGEAELAGVRQPSELANRAATELLEYLAGRRRAFDLPLAPEGTAFQRMVWDELRNTPYGCTRTSGDVARALGRPGSYRAVGGAARKNPLAILIPDHRLSSGGRPLGAGEAARLRGALLALERRVLETT